MKILPGLINQNDDDKWKSAIVEHGKEKVEFNFSLYSKVPEGSIVFRDLNAFLRYFGKVNPAGADKVFKLLKVVNESMGIFGISADTKIRCHGAIRDIYQIITVEAVEFWLSNFEEDIAYPYIPVEKEENYPPEQTYDRAEYQSLVALSIISKFMALIWGDYAQKNKDVPAGTVEEQALSLLRGTTVEESEGFKRFQVFVNALAEGEVTTAGILSGVSSATLPRKAFACAVVNKLCLIQLTHLDDRDFDSNNVINIVANLHRYVSDNIVKLNRGKILTTSKEFKDKATGEEDNTSIAENYSIKEDIPEIMKAFYDYYAKDSKKMAMLGKSDINLGELKELIRFNQRSGFIPATIQFKIVGFVMAPIVGVKSLMYTKRDSAINVISAAQQIAMELGHPNIAALMTASIRHDEHQNPIKAPGKLLKGQIKNAQQELLNIYYPYRLKLKLPRTPYRNPAQTAIEAIADELASVVWNLNVPGSVLNQVTLRQLDTGGWVVREDLRHELAEFVIKINEQRGK